MTEITDEGMELAEKLIDGAAISFNANVAFERLATNHLALKAEHEKAVADLREIDRLASQEPCNWIRERKHDRTHLVAAIAAKYRETDPLVEAVGDALKSAGSLTDEQFALHVRSRLQAYGYELARIQP